MVRVLEKEFPKGTYKGQRGDGFPLDIVLKKNLDFIKDKVLNRRTDFTICIDGVVGIGKSTLAFQIANYLDKNFNLDKVVFTPEQFMTALSIGKKGEVIIFDESINISSRSAMSMWNKRVIQIMTQIRSRQLFIVFVLPSIFDLDKSLALYRTNLLLHCYSKGFGYRGMFSAYFREPIKNLYLIGKKYYSYRKPYPNFKGTFSACFCIDEDAYEQKKQKSIAEMIHKPASRQEQRAMEDRNNLIRYLREKNNNSYREIAELININENFVGKICRGEENT